MLLNLLINARQAMLGRGGSLTIKGFRNPTHPEVLIQVIDNGPGIPDKLLPRIFEPFFTTKAFSTRRGTGLGLSMVYEIAKEMGFGLKVESMPGKGSTFTVILPVWADASP